MSRLTAEFRYNINTDRLLAPQHAHRTNRRRARRTACATVSSDHLDANIDTPIRVGLT